MHTDTTLCVAVLGGGGLSTHTLLLKLADGQTREKPAFWSIETIQGDE